MWSIADYPGSNSLTQVKHDRIWLNYICIRKGESMGRYTAY